MADEEVEKDSGAGKSSPPENPGKPPIEGWDAAAKGISSNLYS